MLELAATSGIVARNGTWYSYGDQRLGQGKERVVQFLEENPALLKQIEVEVRKRLEAPRN